MWSVGKFLADGARPRGDESAALRAIRSLKGAPRSCGEEVGFSLELPVSSPYLLATRDGENAISTPGLHRELGFPDLCEDVQRAPFMGRLSSSRAIDRPANRRVDSELRVSLMVEVCALRQRQGTPLSDKARRIL